MSAARASLGGLPCPRDRRELVEATSRADGDTSERLLDELDRKPSLGPESLR